MKKISFVAKKIWNDSGASMLLAAAIVVSSTVASASPSPVQISEAQVSAVAAANKPMLLPSGYLLGFVTIDVGVSLDLRGYEKLEQKGRASIVYSQTTQDFRVGKALGSSGKAKLEGPANAVEGSISDRDVNVVGLREQVDGREHTAYAGVSKLTLSYDGRILTAHVYLQASDQSLQENKYHIDEDYSFELQFISGNWEQFLKGGNVDIQATPKGFDQYKAGILKTLRKLTARTAQRIEQRVDWVSGLVIPDGMGTMKELTFNGGLRITGTVDKLVFQHAQFRALYWGPALMHSVSQNTFGS